VPLTRWADTIERGERLDPADLTGRRFRTRFRGYNLDLRRRRQSHRPPRPPPTTTTRIGP